LTKNVTCIKYNPYEKCASVKATGVVEFNTSSPPLTKFLQRGKAALLLKEKGAIFVRKTEVVIFHSRSFKVQLPLESFRAVASKLNQTGG
jgi:hypothetical protein